MDSIRSFDAESQRSLENLDEIAIYPAVEWNDGKEMVSLWIIFPKKKCFCFWMNQTVFWKNGLGVEEEYAASRTHREEKRGAGTFRLTGFVLLKGSKELNKLVQCRCRHWIRKEAWMEFHPEVKSDGAV